MKRLLFLCSLLPVVLLGAACSSKPTVQPLNVIAQTATPDVPRAETAAPAPAGALYVCVELANVRTGAGTSFPVLKQMTQGEPVVSTQKSGEWYYMGKDSSGADAYIHDSVVCSRTSPTSTAQPGVTSSSGTTPLPGGTAAPDTNLCPGGCSTPPPPCVIKGNIQAGERIYYTTEDKGYSGVVVDPDYGERWFCSEAEAQAAGWKRTK
ncbi:MAG: SH3 domain-containing protein [Rudaea sp.]